MTSEQPNNPESAGLDRNRPTGGQASDSHDAQRAEAGQQADSSGAAPAAMGTEQVTGASSEDRLVEQTKQQIRSLVREIAQLAQSDIDPNEFFEGFMGRVVSALAAEGGAVWMLDDSGRLELQYQINIQKTGLADSEEKQMRHGLLLKKTLSNAAPGLIPPQSGVPDDEEAGNPTDYLVLLGPVKIEQQVQGIVEVFQRPGAGPATQRGYLRFVLEMCEIVGDYLKSRRLRSFTDRESLWQKLEGFISAVHVGLDPNATSYTIANEARRLIECDRVSVARRSGGKYRVTAVSGSDNIDPRASTVRDLGRLATAVAATRDPIWYTGNSEDLPPQIENSLQSYLDQSHSKMVAVLPLKKTTDEAAPAPGQKKVLPEVVGVLIAENIEDNRVDVAMRQRVEVVVQHSSRALGNAEEHNSLFLMPIWRAIGKAKWVIQGRTLPKTIAIVSAILATILALVIVPADFDLKGDGELQPVQRREVFAQVDGLVADVEVAHLEKVTENQRLARLKSTEIDAEIEAVLGEHDTVQQQIDAVERKLVQRGFTDEEETQLQGDLDSLEAQASSLSKQIGIYKEKQANLDVLSPMDGTVVTWKLQDQLTRRPVKTGQKLMTVVDPTGEWELEVYMAESRLGHIGRARDKSLDDNKDLKVTYILATDPGREFSGRVVDIHGAADVHGEKGNTVKLRVAIQRADLFELGRELRPGTSVTAKVHCGRRSIGYVWLHDLIAWVQTNILFWL